MNRRAFMAGASTAALAGCTAFAAPPDYDVSIDGGDLFLDVEPREVDGHGLVGELAFELTPLTGEVDIHVIDGTRERDVFAIPPDSDEVTLSTHFLWSPPLGIEAVGHDDRVIDSAEVREVRGS